MDIIRKYFLNGVQEDPLDLTHFFDFVLVSSGTNARKFREEPHLLTSWESALSGTKVLRQRLKGFEGFGRLYLNMHGSNFVRI